MKKIFKILVFTGLVFLAFVLRRQRYAQIPVPGQSADEYSYSWVGLSLIETGMPVGISGIGGYRKSFDRYINVDRFFQVVSTGDPLTINYPWMDHPPLLGLITGGYAYMAGARVFEDCSALLIRRPIVVIGTISVALAIVYCWLNFGFLAGVLVGLIYGTTPLVVLSSRMIQAENAIIPCFLFCLIGMSQYLKSKKDVWLLLTAMVAGVATLFKLSGVSCILFAILALFFNYKKINKDFWKDTIFFLIISLSISFLYIIYGLVYDKEIFINVLFSNYDRFYGIGSNLIFDLISKQRLTQHQFLTENWIVGSWLIFVVFLLKKQKKMSESLPVLAVLAYLVVYVLFGSQPYGWYAFPFWPMLFVIMARFLDLTISKGKNYIFSFFMILMILGGTLAKLINIGSFQKYASLWRISLSLTLLIMTGVMIGGVKSKKMSRVILLILLTVLFYGNVKYLNGMTIELWWNNIS